MTYTDVNGILRWEETDPITPLEATLNAGMDSVSAAITGVKNGAIHFVPDVTARAALATAFAPTATKPLYVHRQDAPAGVNLEFTTNGTVWDTVRGTPGAYSALPLASNWAQQGGYPAPRMRLFQDKTEISGSLLQRTGSGQATSPGSGFVIATLPTAYRPTSTQIVAASIGVAGSLGPAAISISADGNITCISLIGGGTIAAGGGWGNAVVIPTLQFSRS